MCKDLSEIMSGLICLKPFVAKVLNTPQFRDIRQKWTVCIRVAQLLTTKSGVNTYTGLYIFIKIRNCSAMDKIFSKTVPPATQNFSRITMQ